jgi:hypothetical protein
MKQECSAERSENPIREAATAAVEADTVEAEGVPSALYLGKLAFSKKIGFTIG